MVLVLDNLDKIYQEVAEEMGLRRVQVRDIAESQFSFISKTIRAKDLNDIRLQFWGIFKVKPSRLRHLSEEAKRLIKDKTDEFNNYL